MSYHKRFPLALLVLVIVWPASAHPQLHSTITVSGLITDTDSHPLSGIQVSVVWEGGGKTQTTGADGSYNVADVPTSDDVGPIAQR